ncbi:glycosyltransferase family 2 protein [Pararhizobium sp. LjRoot235]|uniref:glycosyltransferase family 2 protein n=1 Tax=Pararhizobium sp. LjRoot235 TaxID=3342291 RepID=UPI003ECCEA62
MKADDLKHGRSLIVIPCLNEAKYIEPLIARLRGALQDLDADLVVVDGGSTDGTRDIVQRIAGVNPKVKLLDNPKKIQSAAVNLAVATLGANYDYMIRIDAHGEYPVDYCQRLMEDAIATGADSVVVAMKTVGISTFQKATAFAQNSKLGNGGSKHRTGAAGHWADHGHHALMRISAFQAVGGYDEMFSHNEDAEFDYRLHKAGYRIWMTDKTSMIYYPRSTAGTLFRQYFGYGRGRAKNFLKHRAMPSIRQMLPLAVVPVAVGALLAVINWAAAIPFVLWAVACLGYGAWMALGQRNPYGPLAAVSAMVMHFAWSAGFWRELLDVRNRRVAS